MAQTSIAQYDMNKFTVSNGAIEDLKELIFLTVLKYGALSEIVEIQQGVRNGKKIGGIGDFDALGTSQKICNPTYNASKLMTVQDEWALGNLTIAEQLCADDFIPTIAAYALKIGTNAGDMTDTEILNGVIEPRLREAIDKAVWRYMFMGNTDAKNVTDGGDITDGEDVALVNAIDGFFKRLFLAVPDNAGKRYVKIDANTESTKDLQHSAIFGSGVATKIFNDLIFGASMKLRQKADKVIYCTQSLADALSADIVNSNKGSALQYESLFDGFMLKSKYNTTNIIALPIWDEMIQSYNDKGATFLNPHRAVFCTKNLLWAGFESINSILPDLDIWYERKESMTYIKGRENMGTVLWEGDLISMAY